MTQLSTGGYVRHRDRMVQQSVRSDLRDTLIACRWMSGVTARPVVDPDNISGGYVTVTTLPDEVMKLLGGYEVALIDYFPEAGGNLDPASEGTPGGASDSRKTDPNTLALDQGIAGDPTPVELGSNMEERPYTFTMAFYGLSDGVALALLNDLRDRYMGRLVRDDHIDLFNYNDSTYDDDTTAPVYRMDVDSFTYALSEDAAVAPNEVHLYFAELQLTDVVDAAGPS